jgi:hypothetical protein
VHFDDQRKIKQIRLYWDQASLLKQVDVIGARAKNWPIRDGEEQIKHIKKVTADLPVEVGEITKQMGDVSITARPGSPRKKTLETVKENAMNDPHATLALFAPREFSEDDASPNVAKFSAPRQAAPTQSAKPPPRDYHDLFVGNESDQSPDTQAKMASPEKRQAKSGAQMGKNYQPSRLFDSDETVAAESPEKRYKSSSTKYNHFDFDDGSNAPDVKPGPVNARPKTKHSSQWDFEDFTTPAKAPQKQRGQEVRHFGWSDDEVPEEVSPVKVQPQPRRDNQPHFELVDDGEQVPKPTQGPSKGKAAVNQSLYKNNLYDEDRAPSPEKRTSQPLVPVVNKQGRGKDFQPHFDMSDNSPALEERSKSDTNKALDLNKAKAVKMLNPQWQPTDNSPVANRTTEPVKATAAAQPKVQDKENVKVGSDKPYQGGDGMGGRKGSGRTWGFGDESDDEANVKKFQAKKIQQGPKDNVFWDF